MESIDREVSFFLPAAMRAQPGDAPFTDDEETTDVHVATTRKASFGTMSTVAISENTRLGPPIPTREFEDLLSDGVPLPIGRDPRKPATPPKGSVRYGEQALECTYGDDDHSFMSSFRRIKP